MFVAADHVGGGYGTRFLQQTVLVLGMPHLSDVGTSYPLGGLLFFAPIEQTVHLAAQPHKLRHCHASCFILHFAQHFLVGRGMQKMLRWIVTGVEEGRIGLHVFVDVFRAYVVAQTVCVGEQEVGMVVLGADVLIVKIVHQRLAEVEDAHAHVDRFVELQVGYLQLHACQVFIEDLELSGTQAWPLVASFAWVEHSCTLVRLRTFSIVFPNTELFISL